MTDKANIAAKYIAATEAYYGNKGLISAIDFAGGDHLFYDVIDFCAVEIEILDDGRLVERSIYPTFEDKFVYESIEEYVEFINAITAVEKTHG